MLTNYLKIAIRNLLRHKGFSIINILGLGIGMTSSILILLWVTDELSYDKFHKDQDRIFRITASLPELNVHAAVSSAPLADAFQQQLPAIESAVRISSLHSDLLEVGESIFEEKRILYADSNFLQFFSFRMMSGDPATALVKHESIVITESMAKKYFGSEDPIGKSIEKNHQDHFTVTGVLADIPSNSHLQFDFIMPMSFLARSRDDLKDNIWDNFNYFTYVRVNHDVAESQSGQEAMAKKFQEIYKANEPNLKVAFALQPLEKIHLHSKLMADLAGHGNIQYVYIFTVVGIFILIVACINFMNLSTARSARRSKEVGLRKVAGAVRFQLIRQFLAESSLIAFLALVVAVAMVYASLPAFNDLAGKQLSMSFLNIRSVLALIGITVFTGLLAGSYPALFLSSFRPAIVLKGNLKTGAASGIFRNVMVVIQFTVSIALLVGTAVVYQQLQFIKNKNIGFDKENLIYSPMTGDLWGKYQTLRSSLDENSSTSNFAFVSDLPTMITNATIGVDWPGKDPNTQPLFSNLAIDEKAIGLFNMTLLAGRNFSKDIAADSTNLIVNEAALKTIGLDVEKAVGSSLTLWNRKGVIIGVVKNFNFQPLQKSIEPLILRYNTFGGIAVVRANPQQTEQTIKAMGDVFKTLNPSYPFTYNFVDEELDKMYRAEQRLGALFTIFAGLAIFISCLGLYGLSAFLAERRTKEIGVRKVLGASVPQLVYLLSMTFTKPIIIAMLIATPLSWYFMNQWLSDFAYHINISWTIFAVAFIICVSIGWLTVSFESIKAAVADPAKSMREE